MKEIQEFAKQFHKEMSWEISNESFEEARASLLNNYMLLTTEVAEVAEELRKAFNMTRTLVHEGMEEGKAFQMSKDFVKEDIGKELADCLAYMLKLYNYFGLDLEETFYSKMDEVKNRRNKDVAPVKK
ncbi:MazG nucleotide pyrophosphohydrolase domain-containing protein [Neobacillus citreus]|uniref:NTP pyrophosphohydrolase MazG-like domain-containing protein n=1 Tax=Neobacillus citreus TaxID=2833578 RepID=A0A942YEE1_9BACI|nr:MazG nucleotide pyrophosphohydrolase domain-containing protein [Neobacillus citreus]MCH6269094.1 hypothetical protein [Neobacillus citreus]